MNNMGTINSNNLQSAQGILDSFSGNVKRIKKEKGLIEREEKENKVILMEDNRQVLFG